MPLGDEPTLTHTQVKRRDEILAELRTYDDKVKGKLPQIDFEIKATAGATVVGAFFTFGASLMVGGGTFVTLCNSRQKLLEEYEALKTELREIQGSDSEATYQPSKEIKELINPKRYGRALGEVGIFAKESGFSVVNFGKGMFTGAKPDVDTQPAEEDGATHGLN